MRTKIGSLASDTLVYGVSTVAGRFLTFLLTPLYTNFLTASEIGEVAAIFSMIAFVNVLYSLGLEPAFMRFWEKDDDQKNKRVYTGAFFGIACIGVVVTLLTILFAPSIASSPLLQIESNGANIIRMAAMIPLFDALVLIPFARLRMKRQPRKFAILRFVAILINVSLNGILVVWLGFHLEGVVLAGVISSAAAFLIFLPSVLSTFKAQGRDPARGSLLKEMFGFGLPTVPSSFSSVMVLVVDRPILLLLTSSATVGLYQTNFRLAIPLMMFVTVFEYAWKPFFLNHRDDPEAKPLFARVLTLFTVVCGLVFLTTAFFIPYIVQMPFIGGKFINPAYWSGLTIIPIIMAGYFFNGVFINMAAGLHITKKTWWFPIATGVAAILNVVATFLLVPVNSFLPVSGIEGAAWAKVIAYIGSAVVLYWYVQKVYFISYDFKRITTIIMITAALYFGVTLVTDDTTLRLWLSIAALPAYVGALLAFRVVEASMFRTLTALIKR